MRGKWCRLCRHCCPPFACHWCRWLGLLSCYFADVSKVALLPLLLACSLPFGCLFALPLSCCLQICPYFAILGRFQRVLGLVCGFVLVACFAWLVCACRVRRFWGLWRVCLPFSLFALPFVLLLVLFSPYTALLWLPFACPLALSCLGFPALSLLLLFPFRTIRKKKGRKGFAPCVLSWCVVVCCLFHCCVWYHKTIAGGFDSEVFASYPSNSEIIAIIAYYLITVSAFSLHHHPARIVRAGLCGAWVGVCFAEAENVAAVVGVNKVLSLLCVVVNCFHCFVFLWCCFLFPFG